jgi:hypothetical protein
VPAGSGSRSCLTSAEANTFSFAISLWGTSNPSEKDALTGLAAHAPKPTLRLAPAPDRPITRRSHARWRVEAVDRIQVEVEPIAEIRNPEDRLVQMEETAWNHVVEQYIEMSEYLAETMSTIESPDHREPDPRAGRER